jgi:hypothetical protein
MGAAPLRVHIVLLASRICRSHATAGPALVRRRRDLPEADSNGVVITRSNGGAIPGSHFDVDVGGHLYGLSSHQTQHCAEQSLRATRPSRECEAVEGASKTLKKLLAIRQWHRLLCSRELFLPPSKVCLT